MKLLVICVVLMGLCSCGSNDSGGDINEINTPFRKNSVVEAKRFNKIEFVEFNTFHDLEIRSEDEVLFRQENFLFKENRLYEKLLTNFSNIDDVDLYNSIHQKEIYEFLDYRKEINSQKSSCRFSLNASFNIPDELIDKVKVRDAELHLIVDLFDE